jgi:lysozyme
MDQSPTLSDAVDLARVARLVRPFETLELRSVRRPGGGWSIGYGHIRSAREGAEVTREEAEALLIYDLRHVAKGVRAAIYAPIQRNQLEALIAFAFHIGTDNFLHSTALHRFNAGDSLGAAQEIERWCCANLDGETQVVDALVRRRAAEKAHFLTPPGGFPKASRARVRPQVETSTAAPVGEAAGAEPSAALAAAHSVAARLRALVPDVAEPAEPQPVHEGAASEAEAASAEPQPIAPEFIAPEFTAPEFTAPEFIAPASVVVAPIEPTGLSRFVASAPSEAEIPPPPMPFDAAFPAAGVEAAAPLSWPPVEADPERLHDPFARGPLDAASIQAPPLDLSPPVASLFRARLDHRAQIPPRPETDRKASSGDRLWGRAPREALWACAALGLAIFAWAIWSILKTNPGVFNFSAGLVGIALMAVAAYVLFVATSKPPPKNA